MRWLYHATYESTVTGADGNGIWYKAVTASYKTPGSVIQKLPALRIEAVAVPPFQSTVGHPYRNARLPRRVWSHQIVLGRRGSHPGRCIGGYSASFRKAARRTPRQPFARECFRWGSPHTSRGVSRSRFAHLCSASDLKRRGSEGGTHTTTSSPPQRKTRGFPLVPPLRQ